jgi:PAS domain S-box-containing protein
MSEKEKKNNNRTPQQVQEALDYAENIVSTIREPLLVLDNNLQIITASKSFYLTFSVSPVETEGKLIYEVGNGQWNIPRLRELLETILPKNTSFENYEVDHEFPDLGRRIMLLNARRIHNGVDKTQKILLAIDDITDRKRIEYEMTSSELRYRRLFETAQDGILILNAETGTISDVNPFLLNMLGYSKQDLVGKKLWEIGFFTDIKASLQAFQTLQAKGYVRYENLPLKSADGRSMEVEFVSNRYAVNGELVIQCNIRDITDRKKTERMRDEFIGIMSHEIKNGLTVIMGDVSTAADSRLSKEQSSELLSDAVEQTEIMTNLVDNLLELARQQSGRLAIHARPVNLREIANTVMRKLKNKSPIHSIVNDVPSDLRLAFADTIRTERILYNLVDNAIKYSPAGGEVRVSASQEGNFLVTGVNDRGPGISPVDQTRLFQSFERIEDTTSEMIQGTGLGLRVCRILVEAQSGRIWVESERDKGSTFYFALPMSGVKNTSI